MCDSLTGVRSRRASLEVLRQQLRRAEQEQASLGIVLIDLRCLERVNDAYGRKAGDDLLVDVARRLESAVRPYDVIGRYGKEEFLVILPGCDAADAAHQAERFRRRLTAEAVAAGKDRIELAAAIAVAATSEGMADLLRTAERRLAEAKMSRWGGK
jgi:diguanylate cyclase (GGDEF)-like protein